MLKADGHMSEFAPEPGTTGPKLSTLSTATHRYSLKHVDNVYLLTYLLLNEVGQTVLNWLSHGSLERIV